MNLTQNINVICLVLFYSLSMVSAGAYKSQAGWIEIGGKNYDFNAVALTQSEASARCIRFGGKLFEPRDAKTNKDVFVKAAAKFNANTRLWIGVSDVGEENSFTYLSDGTLVNWVCETSQGGRAGCWGTSQPVAEDRATPDPASLDLDCVFGTADGDGKWAVSNCVQNVPGVPAAVVVGGINFGMNPAKFGSICEKDVAPNPPPPPPAPSDSTCLKSGITVMIGMLFFCHH
jgi:hypothetical protein